MHVMVPRSAFWCVRHRRQRQFGSSWTQITIAAALISAALLMDSFPNPRDDRDDFAAEVKARRSRPRVNKRLEIKPPEISVSPDKCQASKSWRQT